MVLEKSTGFLDKLELVWGPSRHNKSLKTTTEAREDKCVLS